MMSFEHLIAGLASFTGPQIRERLLQAKTAVAEVLDCPDLPEPRRVQLQDAYAGINAALHDAARNALFRMTAALSLSQEPVEDAPQTFDVPPGMTMDESVALLDEISVESGPPPRAPLPVQPIRRVPAPPLPATEPVRDPRPVPTAYATGVPVDRNALRPWDDADDRIPF